MTKAIFVNILVFTVCRPKNPTQKHLSTLKFLTFIPFPVFYCLCVRYWFTFDSSGTRQAFYQCIIPSTGGNLTARCRRTFNEQAVGISQWAVDLQKISNLARLRRTIMRLTCLTNAVREFASKTREMMTISASSPWNLSTVESRQESSPLNSWL